MARVIVATDFRKKHWNVGDMVELFGEQLEELLRSGDVILAEGEELVTPPQDFSCETCGFVAKGNFGLQAHMKKHRKEIKK